jgi:hypothetical protein
MNEVFLQNKVGIYLFNFMHRNVHLVNLPMLSKLLFKKLIRDQEMVITGALSFYPLVLFLYVFLGQKLSKANYVACSYILQRQKEIFA